MKQHLISFFIFICFAHASHANSTLETSGDYLQIAIPASAIISSYLLEDKNTPEDLRYMQFVKSFTLGLTTTHLIKLGAEKKRPNFGDEQSFPSAHTFAAVSGAAYINSRFGSWYGIPAFLLAGVVGYSRMDSRAHFGDDVLAGAAIGYFFNEYFVGENSGINLQLTKNQVGIGVQGQLDEKINSLNSDKRSLTFLMGPTYIRNLNISGSNGEGINLFNLPREENFNYTSNLQFDYFFNKNNLIFISLHPYEHLGSGTNPRDIQFEGAEFNSGQELDVRWLQYNTDLNYNYLLFDSSFLKTYAGLGININYSRLEVGSQSSQYTSDRIGAIGHFSGLIRLLFSEKFESAIRLSWYNDSETKYFNSKLDLIYKLNNRWQILTRLIRHEQRLELAEFDKQGGEGIISSDSAFNTISLGLKYSF